jgi:hypothetical protein
MNEEYQNLDKIINAAFVNLYTISKRDNTIYFSNINLNNDKHWALLNIIVSYCNIIEPCTICLKMPFFEFIKLRLKFKYKKFKRCTKDNIKMSFDDFINHLEEPNKELITDPFLKITQYYFPRKDKR